MWPASPWLKRVSYRPDAASFGGPQHRPKDTGKHVRVLVAIHVRNIQPGGLNPAYLGFSFRLYLLSRKIVPYGREGKILQTAAEPDRAIGKCRSASADWFTVNQNHVASGGKGGLVFCNLRRLLKAT